MVYANVFSTIFFLFSLISSTQQACSPAYCSRDFQIIKFPFRIIDQRPETCGYPGFDISCEYTNLTILQLPNSGKFSVQYIDYFYQQIRLNDPDNCLARKLLSLNLSGSPFTSVNPKIYSIFNCSSQVNYYDTNISVTPISCLSGSNYYVYAVASSSSVISQMPKSCIRTKNISVPLSSSYSYNLSSSQLVGDILLTWVSPYCTSCETYGAPKPFDAAPIAITITSVIFILVFVCFFIRRRSEATNELSSLPVATRPSITTTSVNESIYQVCDVIVLGESCRLPNPNDDVCSICMSKFKPKEVLTSIDICKHSFHADCINPWFRLNSTCPICRALLLEGKE